MTYEVETPVFVGPFDLLLKMIGRRHVDVMEVNISSVIEDYLTSIKEKEVNLDMASGFVLMAAMLIHLKARFLLPEPDQVDLEDEMELLDQRDRLLARLLGFLTYQGVATVLHDRLQHGSQYVGRSVGIDQDLGTGNPPSLPEGMTPATLAEIMTSLIEEVRTEVDIPMDHLDLDLPVGGGRYRRDPTEGGRGAGVHLRAAGGPLLGPGGGGGLLPGGFGAGPMGLRVGIPGGPGRHFGASFRRQAHRWPGGVVNPSAALEAILFVAEHPISRVRAGPGPGRHR